MFQYIYRTPAEKEYSSRQKPYFFLGIKQISASFESKVQYTDLSLMKPFWL